MKKLLIELMTDSILLVIVLAILVMLCAAINAVLMLPSYIGWITTIAIIVLVLILIIK